MPTQVEVGNAGERIAARELVAKGYRTNIDTKAAGSTDIEARGTSINLLVQVKTAMTPNAPSGLSSDEERNIKARASGLGWQAWEARVQIDSRLAPVGTVVWRQLM
jgi:Holliday junction resolvase-like predicted endonuclease